MTKRKALVTGATGVVGRYVLMHLLERRGWDIVALSRRKPEVAGDYVHLAVDLTDAAETRARLASFRDITHVFYSAYLERADPRELLAVNAGMLVNLVDAVE